MIVYTLPPDSHQEDLEVFAEVVQLRNGTIVKVALGTSPQEETDLTIRLHPEDTLDGMVSALDEVVGSYFVSTNPLALLSGAFFRGGVWVAPTKEEANLWRREIAARDHDVVIYHFSKREAEAFKPIAEFAGATFQSLLVHEKRLYSHYTRKSLGQVFLQNLADELETSLRTRVEGSVPEAIQVFFFAYARALYAQYPDEYTLEDITQPSAEINLNDVIFRHRPLDLTLGPVGTSREVLSLEEGYSLRLALSKRDVPSIMLRFQGQVYVMWESGPVNVGSAFSNSPLDEMDRLVLHGFRSGHGLLGLV